MKVLPQLTANKWGHCAVSEDDLECIWPLNEIDRKAKIEQLANEQGFRLAYYREGLCAIFEKAPEVDNS